MKYDEWLAEKWPRSVEIVAGCGDLIVTKLILILLN